jgi:thiol-disulfide isomerase/thioredoxin
MYYEVDFLRGGGYLQPVPPVPQMRTTPMLFLALSLLTAEPSVSDQFARMASDFAALEKSFHDELVAAKRDSAKISEANRAYQKKWEKAAEEVQALVKGHPEDAAALDGILLLTGEMRWTLDDELTNLALRKKDDPRMGRLCFNLKYRGGEPWAESIVGAVAASNPCREVRAQAVFCRGCQYYESAFPYGRTVPEAEKAPLVEKARKLFREAAKFGDVKTPDGKESIGLKATHELKRLDNLPNLKVGGIAPEIDGNDLEGNRMKLSDYRGKAVMVVFWGSWCGPCMAMVPQEKELWQRHRDKPFVLLGVNCGDKLEVAKKTVADKGMDWRSWYDGEEIRGPIETDYDVRHWPRIFLIDAKGVIRSIDAHGKELDEAVEKLLAEMD